MPFGGDSAPVVIAPTYCSAVAVQSGPGHGSLPPCRWAFPHASTSDGAGLVGIGADLEPQTLIAAYTRGMFPMPHRPEGRIAWWSPPERCVLELDDLVVHRSLRRSCRRFEITVDQAFAAVVHGCADPNRPHGWIDSQISAAYVRLHEAGFAHSVEAWSSGELVGGLYGVALGGLFAGESMFHRARDASKTALVALTAGLRDNHERLIDVQWPTPHLHSLGASVVSRDDYLQRLPSLLLSPPASFFAAGQTQPP